LFAGPVKKSAPWLLCPSAPPEEAKLSSMSPFNMAVANSSLLERRGQERLSWV